MAKTIILVTNEYIIIYCLLLAMEINEEIVISGIAGRFPECENVNQFWQALFDGLDLITVDDRRYPPGEN